VAYFLSERWEYFRFLKAEKIRFMPRWKDVFPVSIFVFASIGLFILQKDLGPSLMMLGLFLILFAVVRKKTILSIIGLSSLAVIYFINYKYQLISITAADRCKIWLDPWNTEVLGGEQIVHSIWSFASGKFWGTGLGLGDPNFAPANHTDLILSSIGEEFGFIGILLIFAVYGILFYRCYVVARNSYSQFTYFLTLGLSSINALQLLFICSGVLGFLPLSGVISPFLSWGKTSMICNFISFAIILVISSQNNEQKETDNLQLIELKKPTKFVYLILAACGFIILGKTFMVQVWNGDENLVKGVIAPVPNEKDKDGLIISKIRRMKYNPRISEVKGELPFGSIYDRNEIPLASSNWDELQKFKDKYAELGVDLEHKCKKGNRCYPFGSKIFHLIGNSFTKIDKDPTKTNQIEIDFENVLRGYNDFLQSEDIKVTRQKIEVDSEGHSLTDEEGNPKITEFEETRKIFKRDYRELLPLLRNRYNPLSIEAYVLKNKNRNVKTTFDIGLQLRLTEVLKTELKNKNLKGSIVVLEPKTGDLLADVNFPFPDDELNPNLNADLQNYSDRARTLTVPPGSTFKVVTAIAALKRDVNATTKEFECIPFNDGSGRVGNFVRNRQVRDMKGDPPHGKIKLKEGLIHSCNAYFAQLGENVAGANELNKTASLFGIETTGGDENKNNVVKLNEFLPQASFGQGQIEASVFQIAKVYATVANNGVMPFGRWITDENNDRTTEPQEIISSSQAEAIADGLHGVVTSGTAQKALGRFTIQIAGKTGTAENGKVKIININGKIIKKWVDLESHSWFAGFAPFNNPNKRIAFAVLVENGGAGGGIAAKIAGEIVKNANDLRIIE
jgi:cell division protein FtsI/penicillin-binding protein 2